MNWKWFLPPAGLILALLALCQACPRIDYSGMVHVGEGQFEMGRDDCLSNEKPRHTVYLSGFWIDQREVTNAEYADFLNAGFQAGWVEIVDVETPSGSIKREVQVQEKRALYLAPYSHPTYQAQIDFVDDVFSAIEGKGQHPVAVSWYGAQAFCESIGKRLPTEAEWEYAAKGGHLNRVASGATDYFLYSGSADADSVAWHKNNAGGSAHQVGQLGPNEIDTYDMSGNMREWCSDWYDTEYYGVSPYENPQGPAEPEYPGQFLGKVMRGGSWRENTYPYEDEIDLELSIDPYRVRVTKRDYG